MLWIWLILAGLFFVAEVMTVNLVSIWFVLGCLAAVVAYLFGAALWLQILVAIGVSVIGFGLFWKFRSKLRIKPEAIEPTNADRIIGQEGLVIQTVDPQVATGQIRVLGQIWSAKSASGQRIDEGQTIRVLRLEGVKAVVELASLRVEQV